MASGAARTPDPGRAGPLAAAARPFVRPVKRGGTSDFGRYVNQEPANRPFILSIDLSAHADPTKGRKNTIAAVVAILPRIPPPQPEMGTNLTEICCRGTLLARRRESRQKGVTCPVRCPAVASRLGSIQYRAAGLPRRLTS
jgi:hypothetical protein